MKADVWCTFAGLVGLSTMVILPTAPALAQSSKNWKCTGNPDIAWDRQIVGCTNAIKSGRYTGKDLAVVFNNRGNTYLAKGDFDRAVADYEQAIRLDPNYTIAFNGRGTAYQAKGEFDHAIADYTEAIRLDPTYILAFNNRGLAYSNQDDYDHAIADFDQVTQLDPNNTIAFNKRGNAYLAKGDLDHALADYTEVIRQDSKDAIAFNNRGNAYLAKGDIDRAIADYNEAIRLDPDECGTHLNRGTANFYSGSLSKAQTDFSRSSELNPKDAYAALWLDIVDRRSSLPSGLAQATTQIDMTKWPAPVIRLYLGQIRPEAVLAAADDPDTSIKKRQACEANFFIGELALQRGA